MTFIASEIAYGNSKWLTLLYYKTGLPVAFLCSAPLRALVIVLLIKACAIAQVQTFTEIQPELPKLLEEKIVKG